MESDKINGSTSDHFPTICLQVTRKISSPLLIIKPVPVEESISILTIAFSILSSILPTKPDLTFESCAEEVFERRRIQIQCEHERVCSQTKFLYFRIY